MNIGEEKEAFIAEPIESPFEKEVPAPTEEEREVFAPVIGEQEEVEV